MADEGDSLTKFFSRAALATDEAEPPETGHDGLALADLHAAAAPRPAFRNLTRLHLVLRGGTVHTFQYAWLDAESTFDGRSFVLHFGGSRPQRVTVRGHGPRFWAAYDYVTLHRWPYLREATGSLPGAAGGDLVITGIAIEDEPGDGT